MKGKFAIEGVTNAILLFEFASPFLNRLENFKLVKTLQQKTFERFLKRNNIQDGKKLRGFEILFYSSSDVKVYDAVNVLV